MAAIAIVALAAAGWTVAAIAGRCAAPAMVLLEAMPLEPAGAAGGSASVDRVAVADASGLAPAREVSGATVRVRPNDGVDLRGRVRGRDGVLAAAVFVMVDDRLAVRARYAQPPDPAAFHAVVDTAGLAPGTHVLRLRVADAGLASAHEPLPPLRVVVR